MQCLKHMTLGREKEASSITAIAVLIPPCGAISPRKSRNALWRGPSHPHARGARHVIDPDAALHLGIITASRKAIS